MADGQYRFHQGAGQHFFQHYNGQSSRQLHHRPGSPSNGGRIGFSNNDTPSPSRSPGPQSPAHPYSMYNNHNNNTHSHHGMLNGAGNRYALQMKPNVNPPFQHHAHQPAQQQHHHQEHLVHANNYVNHQHNQSGGGGLSNSASHFTPSHLQDGTPSNTYNSTSKPGSEHWNKQMERAARTREMTAAHPHARNASVNKNNAPGASNGLNKDGQPEEQYRASIGPKHSGNEDQTWFDLDMGGSHLRTMCKALFSYTFLTRLYFNHNKLKTVPPEIGKLRNLVHLDLSLNQIKELPPQMGMLVNLKELLLFGNQIETLPYELGNLYQLEMIGIVDNPLTEELQSLVREEDSAALIVYLRENAPGPPAPHDREWVVIDDDMSVSQKDKFSVLSFNILCDKAATQSQFGYTPSNFLSWDVRKIMILDEIRGRDADIVALQELDAENYHNCFREALAHNDYKGVFWPRTRSNTMSEYQQKSVDGCAIFYKNSKYILLDKQLIDFAGTAIKRQDMKLDHDVFNRIMVRDNIAVVVYLEDRKTGTRLIVVNAHIFWDETYRDVKLVQVAILMEQVTKLAEQFRKIPPLPEKDKVLYRFANGDKGSGDESEEDIIESPVPSVEYARVADIPLVITGDYNSKPGSGVYDLITSGSLAVAHPDLGEFKYGDLTRDGMKHPFSLKSSYSNLGELPWTNCTPGFTEVIDYIMYSTNSLQVAGVLGQVDPEYMERVPGFPNQHFPSDHITLFSQFVVKRPKEKKVTEADFGQQKDRRHDQ